MELPINILYCIDKLQLGGTERQLCALIANLNPEKVRPFLCLLQHEIAPGLEVNCPKIVLDFSSFLDPRSINSLLKLSRFVRQNKIRIIHTFFQDASLLGLICTRLCKNVVGVSSRRDMGFWKNAKENAKLRIVNRLSDAILANSHSVKEMLTRKEHIPSHKIHVIPNLLTFGQLNSSVQTATPVTTSTKKESANQNMIIGIIANLNREVKRVDLFVKAASIVSKRYNNVFFWVIGAGHLEERLRNYAEQFNLGNRLQFLGARKELLMLLTKMSIGVNTSESEGLSNAVLEYMAAGLAVVASDIPSNRELLTEGKDGLFFRNGDALDLANKLIVLIGNEMLRRRLGETAYESVKTKYSTSTVLEKYYDFYFSIISND